MQLAVYDSTVVALGVDPGAPLILPPEAEVPDWVTAEHPAPVLAADIPNHTAIADTHLIPAVKEPTDV